MQRAIVVTLVAFVRSPDKYDHGGRYKTSSAMVNPLNTGVSQNPRVIRSKTHRGYVKPCVISNAIHNVIFV
jgi:hypothetical protein